MTYYVYTIDPETGRFTPQLGVPCGPHTMAGLKRAAKTLTTMGYGIDARDPLNGDSQDNNLLVTTEPIEEYREREEKHAKRVREQYLARLAASPGSLTLPPRPAEQGELFA